MRPCVWAGSQYEPTWRADAGLHRAARRAKRPTNSGSCEHPPVFTLGLAGEPEHLLTRLDIPVVKIDRGGQITYHGPGQVVVYLLLDLRRARPHGVKDWCTASSRR